MSSFFKTSRSLLFCSKYLLPTKPPITPRVQKFMDNGVSLISGRKNTPSFTYISLLLTPSAIINTFNKTMENEYDHQGFLNGAKLIYDFIKADYLSANIGRHSSYIQSKLSVKDRIYFKKRPISMTDLDLTLYHPITLRKITENTSKYMDTFETIIDPSSLEEMNVIRIDKYFTERIAENEDLVFDIYREYDVLFKLLSEDVFIIKANKMDIKKVESIPIEEHRVESTPHFEKIEFSKNHVNFQNKLLEEHRSKLKNTPDFREMEDGVSQLIPAEFKVMVDRDNQRFANIVDLAELMKDYTSNIGGSNLNKINKKNTKITKTRTITKKDKTGVNIAHEDLIDHTGSIDINLAISALDKYGIDRSKIYRGLLDVFHEENINVDEGIMKNIYKEIEVNKKKINNRPLLHFRNIELSPNALDLLSLDISGYSFNEIYDRLKIHRQFTRDGSKIKRQPILTVMGHVNHGKTTLLDALRGTNVASLEAGGITQKLGSFTFNVDDQIRSNLSISCIDTPGHELFSKMRKKSAVICDVVVLVIDMLTGVQEQTIECLNLIAQDVIDDSVKLIIACSKMDKVPSELLTPLVFDIRQSIVKTGLNLPLESIPFIPISSKEGINMNKLIESMVIASEANYSKLFVNSQESKFYILESSVWKDPSLIEREKITEIKDGFNTLKETFEKKDLTISSKYIENHPERFTITTLILEGNDRLQSNSTYIHRDMIIRVLKPSNNNDFIENSGAGQIVTINVEILYHLPGANFIPTGEAFIKTDILNNKHKMRHLLKEKEWKKFSIDNRSIFFNDKDVSTLQAFQELNKVNRIFSSLSHTSPLQEEVKLKIERQLSRINMGNWKDANLEEEHRFAGVILKGNTPDELSALVSQVSLYEADHRFRILSATSGPITSSDVELAISSGAGIFGFNSTILPEAERLRTNAYYPIILRTSNIIYSVLDDIETYYDYAFGPSYIYEELVRMPIQTVVHYKVKKRVSVPVFGVTCSQEDLIRDSSLADQVFDVVSPDGKDVKVDKCRIVSMQVDGYKVKTMPVNVLTAITFDYFKKTFDGTNPDHMRVVEGDIAICYHEKERPLLFETHSGVRYLTDAYVNIARKSWIDEDV